MPPESCSHTESERALGSSLDGCYVVMGRDALGGSVMLEVP